MICRELLVFLPFLVIPKSVLGTAANERSKVWYTRPSCSRYPAWIPYSLRKVPRLPDGRKPLRAAECQKCGKAFMLEGPHLSL